MGDALGIIAALGQQHEELASILTGLSESDWQRPTRCEGWVVADVVLHLAQTDELSIGSLRGEYGRVVAELMGTATRGMGNVDDGAAAMVEAQRGESAAAVFGRWRDGASGLRSLLAAADEHMRVQWVAGELSITTLATTRLAETWLHTGDVADAVGVQLKPGDRLRHIVRLAWRTLPYAFARAGRELSGPVAFELMGPAGEEWNFAPADEALTVILGDGVELCLVAGQRLDPKQTALKAIGPDGDAVLELVRTYA